MSMTSTTSINPAGGQARSTRGRAPVSTPMRQGEVLDLTVTELSVNYAEGQHDQAVLSCISSTLEDTEGFIDSAFSFYFGVAPRATLFQGYITAVTDAQEAQGQLSFTLTVLGASKVMFEGAPRFWVNKSVPAAIRDLAGANNLGFYSHSQTRVWRSLAQTEESDWMMVNRLAQRIGWVLYYRFGVLMLCDPNYLYTTSGEYTTLLASQTNPEVTDTASSRNMISFQATEDAEVLPQSLGKKFGYFTTADEPQVKTQAGEFKGFLFETGSVVRDQEEATAYITSADTNIDGWRIHAVARIWGDSDIFPGMCVSISTTSGFSKNDGRWLVRVVSHQADRQSYQTQLMLSRPRNWVGSGQLPYRPFWEEDMTTTRSRPYLQEIQGKWFSSWKAT